MRIFQEPITTPSERKAFCEILGVSLEVEIRQARIRTLKWLFFWSGVTCLGSLTIGLYLTFMTAVITFIAYRNAEI